MPSGQSNPLLRYIRRLAGRHGDGGGTDGQLLDCFLGQRDEAAFETLLARHGPMVLGTCRRLLHDLNDVEDAFQATFLVLCRKAGSIGSRDSVGGWLHQVACRIALKVKADAARRPALAGPSLDRPAPEVCPELDWNDLRPVLDAELGRLPEKYRAPLVLHYLEGKTVTQVAHELGWSHGTASCRLARARERLRTRLTRRGLTVTMAALATVLIQQAGAKTLPLPLVESTAKLAALSVLGQAVMSGGVVTRAAILARGALHAMLITKLKIAAGVLVACGALATGAGLLTHYALAEKQAAEGQSTAPQSQVAEQPKAEDRLPNADRHGDPLPDGAVARLGTVRFNHGYGLNALHFSPDGKTIISEGHGFVRLWDAATGKELRSFTTGRPWFNDQTALSADGKTMVTLHEDRGPDTVRVWDLAQGKEVRTLPLPVPRSEHSVYRRNALSPDGRLAVIHTPQQLQVFDLATGKALYKLPKGEDQVHVVTFASTDRIVTVDKKQLVEVWEARTGKRVRQFLHSPPAANIPWAAPAVASGDGSWLATLERRTLPFRLPDGSEVPLHDRDVIHVWDLATGTRKHILIGQPKRRHVNVQFSPDGRRLFASGSGPEWDYALTVWDLATGQPVRELIGAQGKCIAVSPDGTRLVEGKWWSKFDLWDLNTGTRLSDEESQHAQTETIFLSPVGDRIFTFGASSVSTWDGTTGGRLNFFDLPPYPYRDPGRCHFFSPDGRYALSFPEDNGRLEILVWDVAARRRLHTIRLPDMPTYITSAHRDWTRPFYLPDIPCAFSPDSSLLATWHPGKASVVRLWDVRTGKEVRSFPDTKAGKYAQLSFSVDGKTLFVVGQRIVGLDVASGKERFSWRMDPLPSKSQAMIIFGDGTVMREEDRAAWRTLAISPDGTLAAGILSGGLDGHERVENRIALCDARTGKVIRRWNDSGIPARIGERLSFSPDGKLLASSDVGTVHVWEVATGKEVRSYRGHRGDIHALAFSADGRRLASSSEDNTVVLWDLTLAPRSVEPGTENPDGKQVAAWWDNLASPDAGRAYAAVWRLAEVPGVSVPFLRQRLKPVTDAQVEAIHRHIENLDSDSFAVRQEAFRQLQLLGPAAAPALRQTLEKKVPLEVRRRIEPLLDGLTHGPAPVEYLRTLRALAVLEHAGTADARRLLQELAGGAPEAWLTQEAQSSFGRMPK
jgi:RNA polymerase sigma factor (sigma-70 family)